MIFFKHFKDHHRFNKKEIRELIAIKEKTGSDYLITTEKDWVRLEGLRPNHPELAYLTIRFAIVSREDQFFQIIKDRFGAKSSRQHD